MRTIEEQRAYQAGYVSAARKLWFEEHGPCVNCGSWEKLEIDHVNPEEKRTHRVWSLSREERQKELAKCQVLCEECHQTKTNAEHTKPLVHGTVNGYNQKGCRCDECKRWNRDRARAYHARKRKEIAGAGHDPATSAL